MPKKTGKWSLEDIAMQAVVLYEGEREHAVEQDNLQAIQFWESHRNNAIYALRGTDTPVSEDEVTKLITQWNKRSRR